MERLWISGRAKSFQPGTSDTSGKSLPIGIVASIPTEDDKPPSVAGSSGAAAVLCPNHKDILSRFHTKGLSPVNLGRVSDVDVRINHNDPFGVKVESHSGKYGLTRFAFIAWFHGNHDVNLHPA